MKGMTISKKSLYTVFFYLANMMLYTPLAQGKASAVNALDHFTLLPSALNPVLNIACGHSLSMVTPAC